jgi:HAD superfamily hydrolase (TIGR01509 family)
MKTILVDAVDGIVSDKGVLFQEMYNLLETYPNPKIIVTGANDEQFQKFGLDKMPYEVFTLKHDPEKTDPKYFEILLEKYTLKPEDIVYFEHNKAAAESAQSIGITSYYYDSNVKNLNALKSFLDLNV